MLLPMSQIAPELLEFESREGILGTVQIPQRAFEHGASAAQIAARLVMERDCQLDQPLQVLLGSGRWRQSPPDVFEDFVGVEESAAVEQVQAGAEGSVVGWSGQGLESPGRTEL
jgi:hypothetical protein